MNAQTFDFSKTNQFSKLFLDYIAQKEPIREFQNYPPSIDGIEAALKSRKFNTQSRQILVTELKKQYENIETSPKSKANIENLLNDNTFTVTCGHQLNLFTGPLYFIYKIITTIKLAEQLKTRFPESNFVPIYWMASEDHDFEEINHFFLFGKKHTWEFPAKGAVGKIVCDTLQDFLATLPQELEHFAQFYKTSSTLAEATAKLVNHLFAAYGLVVLNPDVASLRSEFADHFIKELTERNSFNILKNNAQKLENLDYKTQVSGREINLMYADHGLRERIVFEEGSYKVLNTDLVLSETEIIDLVRSNPEKFSTNVILRPIYQEVILPNLAFIGGPAEVIYWMQLKEIFVYFGVTMPVVLPRNFAMVVNSNQTQKILKAGLQPEDIFLPELELKQKITSQDLSLDFSEENEVLKSLEQLLSKKAEMIDKSLIATVAAENSKITKIVDELEKRLNKALEKRNVDVITQILNIKQKLYPNGSPQERIDNFLNFYLNDDTLIQQIYEHFEPLDFKYYMLER
jgi:bacillithiol synthase